MYSSKSNEWATPQYLFDELNERYGFNLDPSSTDENAKCCNHFTICDDGLKQSWGGIACSAILLMGVRLANGLKRVIQNH